VALHLPSVRVRAQKCPYALLTGPPHDPASAQLEQKCAIADRALAKAGSGNMRMIGQIPLYFLQDIHDCIHRATCSGVDPTYFAPMIAKAASVGIGMLVWNATFRFCSIWRRAVLRCHSLSALITS
jgi:hypothetical protein